MEQNLAKIATPPLPYDHFLIVNVALQDQSRAEVDSGNGPIRRSQSPSPTSPRKKKKLEQVKSSGRKLWGWQAAEESNKPKPNVGKQQGTDEFEELNEDVLCSHICEEQASN